MIIDLLKKSDKNELTKHVNKMHTHDLSTQIEALDDLQKKVIYELLSNARLADLLSYLPIEKAAFDFIKFQLEKQKELINLMEPDDATDLIQELRTKDRQLLLNILGEQSDVSKLIIYDEDETGSAMTNKVVVLVPDMDVKAATKKVIKEAVDVESITTLFVVDSKNIFLGVVLLKKLIKTRSPSLVSNLIEDSPFVFDYSPITQTLEDINNYGIFEMPVCNKNKELVGMITIDDALDIYQEEAREDFEKLAGLPETVSRNAVLTAFHRLPWLVLLLILFVPIALVTSLFEEVLAAVVILVVFQPLILDSAGNVATQTLAVTLKMMSTNEKGFVSNSLREIATGMINGFLIGVIAFLVTFIFAKINVSLTTQPILLSFVVSVSLWATVIFAPVIAIMIPVTLKAFRIDPAVASGPFITTLIDIAALFIYFGLATLMLGGI